MRRGVGLEPLAPKYHQYLKYRNYRKSNPWSKIMTRHSIRMTRNVRKLNVRRDTCSYSVITVLFDEAPSIILPGAGLSQLDFSQDSDFIYDSLFTSSVQLDSQSSGNSPQTRSYRFQSEPIQSSESMAVMKTCKPLTVPSVSRSRRVAFSH